MSDSFPAELECLFNVPAPVADDDLRRACEGLAGTMKSDLLSCNAPVELVMLASAALNQYAKHFQATRKPYGFPELGGYTDPGSERAALSSLNQILAALQAAMVKLRVIHANPAQLQAAREERDQAFIRVVQALLQKSLEQGEGLAGTDLQFWLQATLFPLMQEEGLAE